MRRRDHAPLPRTRASACAAGRSAACLLGLRQRRCEERLAAARRRSAGGVPRGEPGRGQLDDDRRAGPRLSASRVISPPVLERGRAGSSSPRSRARDRSASCARRAAVVGSEPEARSARASRRWVRPCSASVASMPRLIRRSMPSIRSTSPSTSRSIPTSGGSTFEPLQESGRCGLRGSGSRGRIVTEEFLLTSRCLSDTLSISRYRRHLRRAREKGEADEAFRAASDQDAHGRSRGAPARQRCTTRPACDDHGRTARNGLSGRGDGGAEHGGPRRIRVPQRTRLRSQRYSGQKPSSVSPSPRGSSIRVETITSSASSGSSFQTDRADLGRRRGPPCPAELDDLVAELELELARRSRSRSPPASCGGARTSPCRPVCCGIRRYVSATCSAPIAYVMHAHLARVVAEHVVDLLERHDRVARHLPSSFASASIEHLSERTRNRLDARGLHSRVDDRLRRLDASSTSRCPAIQRDLGGGLALQQWVVDAYLLTLGSLLLVGGSLGDLFGARRVFLIGIVGVRRHLASSARLAPDGTLADPRRAACRASPGALLTPAGARHDHRRLQRRGARRRDRHLDRVDRDRVRDRPARRRLARHARLAGAGSS